MRRLPVIQQTASDDAAAAARPPWHWCLIGGGLAATIWVPLSVVAAPLGTAIAARVLHTSPSDVLSGALALTPRARAILAVVSGAPVLASFAVAAGLAGAMVGRFGGRAGPREAAVAGILAAVLVTSVASLAGSGLPTLVILIALLVLAVVGAGLGFVGGRFGVRKRPC